MLAPFIHIPTLFIHIFVSPAHIIDNNFFFHSLFLMQINSVLKTADKSVTAELTILANVTDNQARYRCEAQNSATEIPLFETKTLSVHCKY